MNIFFNRLLNTSNVATVESVTATFLADVYVIPTYGQSLSINTSAGASTYTETEPLSYDVNLDNTNIQDMCAGIAEAFRLMAIEDNVSIPENFKIVGCLGGAGGQSIAQLSKGSSYYQTVLDNITDAKAACDLAGLSMVVPCFTWTQGEENMRAGGVPANYGTGGFDPLTYHTQLIQLVDDFNADIKAITGQTTDVLCISYQVASHNPYGRYPRIAMQQDLAAQTDDRIIIAKVMYDIDYDATDQVHAPARTYRNMGNMYGIAAWRKTVTNQPNKHLRPLSHVVNGSTITVTFDVPVSPLVLDTTLVTPLADGNYGFNILNVSSEDAGTSGTSSEATTTIESVVLRSINKVDITCNRVPVPGERLTYGINGNGWDYIAGTYDASRGKSGRINGARGCLRDSQPIENNNTGAVFTKLYNWCVIFEIEL